jgi:hypothetical protein
LNTRGAGNESILKIRNGIPQWLPDSTAAGGTTDQAARDTASLGNTNAQTALTKAAIAQDTASLANRMGHTAITKAAIAQDTASAANKQAWTADTKAQNAQSTANAAVAKSDTNALHAQKFKILENVDAGKAGADSVQAALLTRRAISDTTKPAGTVTWTLVRTEIKDTLEQEITAGTRDVGGARDVAITGRYISPPDSLSLVGESGDVLDWSMGNVWVTTVTQNDTITFTNITAGQTITLRALNAGTYTLTFVGVDWASGTHPTFTSGANKRDVFTFIAFGATEISGSVVADAR